MGKLQTKLLQARLRLGALSDFGSQVPIGFLCLRGALRGPQLQGLIEMLQLRFVFFLIGNVLRDTKKYLAVPLSK
jgi:hypothetical protein